MSATSPRQTASPQTGWSEIFEQLEHHRGPVLLAAGAVALLLIVSFVGVLQGAVQRGELLRAQQHLAASASKPATVVVVARSGR